MEEEADFLFEKHYDALVLESGNRTGNELNGDCQLGQLLMRGYEQELMNGYVVLIKILKLDVVVCLLLKIGSQLCSR
jgi:hypothetical protein